MNDRLKIKDIEGNAGQIQDLCKNLGFDLNSYLNEKPTKKDIPRIWIWITAPLFFICCCLLWVVDLNPNLFKILILFSLGILGFVVFTIQYNYGNWIYSLISGITGLILLLVALEVYTPQEVLKKLEEQTTNKIDND